MGRVTRVRAGDALQATTLELAEQIAGYTVFGLRRRNEVIWHQPRRAELALAIAIEENLF